MAIEPQTIETNYIPIGMEVSPKKSGFLIDATPATNEVPVEPKDNWDDVDSVNKPDDNADVTGDNNNWSEITDDDSNRPDDNATEGATAGTDLRDSGATVRDDDEVINKFIAGDDLLQSADAERTEGGASFVKKKDISVDNWHGILRVKFDLKHVAAGDFGEGIIRLNGVDEGTLRSTTLDTYTTYSEDITIVAGDNIQLYIRRAGATGTTFCRNFRIYKLDVEATTVVLN